MDDASLFSFCFLLGLAASGLIYLMIQSVVSRRQMEGLETERQKIDADWNAAFAAYLSSPVKGKGDDHS